MKKYSVFVSSTYQDLIEERKEVIQALLELDCIPIGMELFPATDDDQWTLIKELIEDCDYYILIIGGRYGSLNNEGVSFTQMEYEYAVKIGVPVISFLHGAPEKIIAKNIDKEQEKQERLVMFRKLASEKMIKYWESPKELGSVVSRSLIKLIKSKPRTGWVKADQISTNEANLEILQLKERIQLLEEELKNSLIKDTSNLVQGNDLFNVSYGYKKNGTGNWISENIKVEWNTLFSKISTILLDEGTEESLKSRLDGYVGHLLKPDKPEYKNVLVYSDNFMTILIQLKALGLIEKSDKKRSLRDSSKYWRLTQRGDDLITQLRAIKKDSIEENRD